MVENALQSDKKDNILRISLKKLRRKTLLKMKYKNNTIWNDYHSKRTPNKIINIDFTIEDAITRKFVFNYQ